MNKKKSRKLKRNSLYLIRNHQSIFLNTELGWQRERIESFLNQKKLWLRQTSNYFKEEEAVVVAVALNLCKVLTS